MKTNKEYRIHWLGYEGGWGYVVQQKKRWWIFSYWETLTEAASYHETEDFYKNITNENTIS